MKARWKVFVVSLHFMKCGFIIMRSALFDSKNELGKTIGSLKAVADALETYFKRNP